MVQEPKREKISKSKGDTLTNISEGKWSKEKFYYLVETYHQIIKRNALKDNI